MKSNHSKSGTSTLRLLTTILHSDGDLTEQGKIRYRNNDCLEHSGQFHLTQALQMYSCLDQ